MRKLVVVLLCGAVLFSCNDEKESSEPKEPPCEARIKNTGKTVILGEKHVIRFKLSPECVKEALVKIDGVERKTYTDISDDLTFEWETNKEKLGSHRIELEVELDNGQKRKSNVEKILLANKPPQMLTAKIIKEYPHDPLAFTQGLEFSGDRLLESTGTRGTSWLREVNLEDGTVVGEQTVLDNQYFGEGITVFGDKIYQITYQSGEGFVYDLETLKQIDQFTFSSNTREGWGLSNDGENLLMTDGSHRIYFVNPENFTITKSIEVFTNSRPLSYLNELEYIEGKIYANIYQDNKIAVINPNNGMVESIINMSALESALPGMPPEVLNGIAYHKESGKMYATGKLWPLLFEFEVE